MSDLFACLPVTDFAASRRWYRDFVGAQESFCPNDIEAVWAVGDHAYIYIEELPERAGRSKLMLMTSDIEAQTKRLALCGLSPSSVEEYDGMRKVCYLDPDGNEVSYGGAAGQ